VRDGDTVKKIAARFDLGMDTIIAANALGSGDYIQVGQQLWLQQPDADTRARMTASDPHEAFIQNLAHGAQESQRRYGVPASVTLAQAILETYWGTSYLAREANNYFGIKAYGKPGTDGVIWMEAWEVDDAGRNVTSSEPFRRYTDPGESLVDHGLFFIENRRYARALEAGTDPREFARRINVAGYATDPAYAAKLISYMDRYNLYQWDVTP
jgi:flagellar protein FlgJ